MDDDRPVPPGMVPDFHERLDKMVEAARTKADLDEQVEAERQKKAAQQGVTTAAINMRATRKDPKYKQQEAKAKRAAIKALYALAANHEDEYLILHQEERAKLDLQPLRPRIRRTSPTNHPTHAPTAASASPTGVVGAETAPKPAGNTTAAVVAPPQQGSTSRAPEIVKYPLSLEEQAACRHHDLRKLAYGTWCNECGKRIR